MLARYRVHDYPTLTSVRPFMTHRLRRNVFAIPSIGYIVWCQIKSIKMVVLLATVSSRKELSKANEYLCERFKMGYLMIIVMHVVITYFLIIWPVCFFHVAITVNHHVPENRKQFITFSLIKLYYPFFIFAILAHYNINFFWIDTNYLAAISFVVILLSSTLFGCHKAMLNMMRGIPNFGYGLDNKNIYFSRRPIPNAEKTSFFVYNPADYFNVTEASLYAQDNHHLYYSGRIVPKAKPIAIKGKMVGDTLFLANEHQVIHKDKVVDHADPDYFGAYHEDEKQWLYLKVKDKVVTYHINHLFSAIYADADTFTPLDPQYAKDKDHIYRYDHIILRQADPSSFTLIGHRAAKDKQSVYILKEGDEYSLNNADPQSFTFIDEHLAIDHNKVYYFNEHLDCTIIQAADPSSFRLLTDNIACDNNHVYCIQGGCRIVEGVNPDHFEALGYQYYRSKETIYFYDNLSLQPIVQADASTFRVIANESQTPAEAQDQYQYYKEGKPVVTDS